MTKLEDSIYDNDPKFLLFRKMQLEIDVLQLKIKNQDIRLLHYENWFYKNIKCKNCKQFRNIHEFVNDKKIYVFCKNCMSYFYEHEFKKVII